MRNILNGDSMPKFGIKFPLELDNGQLKKVTGEEKIEQAIKVVLTTYPGERWGMPEYGSKLFDLIFQPDSVFLRSRICAEIEATLRQWIPQMNVEEVQVRERREEEGHILITIKYSMGVGIPSSEREIDISFVINKSESVTK